MTHDAHITEGLLTVTLSPSSLSRLTKPFANKQFNNSYHAQFTHKSGILSKIQTTLLNKGVSI